MMDTIREQLVKRPKMPEDGIKKFLIIAGAITAAIVLIGISMGFIQNWLVTELCIFGSIGIVWGGIVLAGRLNVEYEYIIAGDEIQVDKIFNKRSRKTLCSFKLRSAEAFYASEKRLQDATIVDACGEGQKYTVEFNDPSDGKTVLIFTPDEKTLDAVKPYLPRLS